MSSRSSAIAAAGAAAAKHAGFIGTGTGCFRNYKHPSGWEIGHCGHPTALWPWAVIDPQGRIHTSGAKCDLGYAFAHVEDAVAHVLRHLRGELVGGGR